MPLSSSSPLEEYLDQILEALLDPYRCCTSSWRVLLLGLAIQMGTVMEVEARERTGIQLKRGKTMKEMRSEEGRTDLERRVK